MKPTANPQRLRWLPAAGVFTSDTLRQRRLERRARQREAQQEIEGSRDD